MTLKSNWLTRSMTCITEQYSMPAYDGVDPNPVMAPFFILFFGMMMADMGYGLLMIFLPLAVPEKGTTAAEQTGLYRADPVVRHRDLYFRCSHRRLLRGLHPPAVQGH